MSDITVEEAGMHHSIMVRDFVSGIQEDLQQEQFQKETTTVVQAPVDHVVNC